MTNRGINQSWVWCVFFCLLLNGVVTVSAAEYEVDGQIEQTLYNWDGSVQSVEQAKFTVFVRDCSWLIQTTYLDKDGKPFAIDETACTNGGLIYSWEWTLAKTHAAGRNFGLNGANISFQQCSGRGSGR